MSIEINLTSQNSGRAERHTNNVLYRTVQHLLALPRPLKQGILIIADFVMATVCLYFALALRFGYMNNHISPLALGLYAFMPIIGLYAIGFYKAVARVFFDTAMRSVLQLFAVLIIIYEGILYFQWMPNIPRSVPIFYLFLFFIWLWNSRLTIKELLTRWQGKGMPRRRALADYDNVVIYGAGMAGRELLDGLRDSHKYNVVAFIDDNPQLTGAYILGKRIYAADQLVTMIDTLNVAQIFLAVPSISRARKRDIIDKLADISIKIKELPSLQELADEKVTVSHMRKIDILDVLDRQTVEPDEALLQKNIMGKSVLVTGAGGSIGSELCRQIIKNEPVCLVLYELSEYAL